MQIQMWPVPVALFPKHFSRTFLAWIYLCILELLCVLAAQGSAGKRRIDYIAYIAHLKKGRLFDLCHQIFKVVVEL